jgi:type IV pilus assembly protein PilV
VCRTSSGFTLIEFLVAVVILMVGLLGLLQAVNVALYHNVNNQIRNEAVVLADQQMTTELGKGFDQVSTTTRYYAPVSRQVINGFKSYSVVRNGTTVSNSKEITFTISWRNKGTRYEHSTTSVISKTY